MEHIESGKAFKIPRGKKIEDGVYEHVHAHRGTVEFWLRVDTDDAGIDNPHFLRFGKMSLWRRTQTGTYYNLGKGFLQSGFLIRSQAWYHIAMTWDQGNETKRPAMELYVNGIPMKSLMQMELPADTGDWTGEALSLGTSAPMHVCGLRISSTARDAELRQGRLSPPPTKTRCTGSTLRTPRSQRGSEAPREWSIG